MIQEQTTVISSITAISQRRSPIAAFTAILVEIRTNRRFSKGLEREERLALANIKPLLAVYPSKFINHKAVTLHNYGIGTAVMTGISFAKGNKVDSPSLVNVFNFSEKVIWDHSWSFRQRRLYVQPGQDVVLVKLTEENLAGQGSDASERFLMPGESRWMASPLIAPTKISLAIFKKTMRLSSWLERTATNPSSIVRRHAYE